MLSLTGLEKSRRTSGRELGVSDWQLVPQENLDALAQGSGEERFVYVDVECCASATA